jgi:hypothetical protein
VAEGRQTVPARTTAEMALLGSWVQSQEVQRNTQGQAAIPDSTLGLGAWLQWLLLIVTQDAETSTTSSATPETTGSSNTPSHQCPVQCPVLGSLISPSSSLSQKGTCQGYLL